MTDSPFRSQAQLAMFTRAAKDADYAKALGFSCEAAQQMLDAHTKAGAPQLPERAPAAVTPIGKPKTYKLLGAR